MINTDEIILNGNAAFLAQGENSIIRLTESQEFQTGVAVFEQPYQILGEGTEEDFSSSFSFRIDESQGIGDEDGAGADGLAFVILPSSDTVGESGGGLGYAGIGKSIAVEFDTFQNDEPNGNHLGININGNLVSEALVPVEGRFNDGVVRNVWVDYVASTKSLNVFLSDNTTKPEVALLSHEIDLSQVYQDTGEIFFGFAAATGSGTNTHDILSFTAPVEDIDVVGTAPSAEDDAASTAYETSVTIDVLNNDSDVDGDALSITSINNTSGGTATIEDGKVLFNPEAGFSGDAGFDYIITDGNGNFSTASVSVTVNNPVIITNHNIGTNGNDKIKGTVGADLLEGLDGNDTLIGGAGADTLDGGADVDLASYRGTTSYVKVDLADSAQNAGAALGDVLIDIENLEGGDGNNLLKGNSSANVINGGAQVDEIYGRGGNDTLFGNAGDDALYGQNGNDVIFGGAGVDVLSGGNGADRFLFGAATDSAIGTEDTITDFTVGVDKLDVKALGISALVVAELAAATEVRVAYDAVANVTSVVSDGLNFAVELAGEVALTASDFLFA
jgi:Legume lectin domain/Cadherin-like domain/Peptidase M10 serralysin C terminal/RTX calcium-binding nonapeptide repeat (4 copies)